VSRDEARTWLAGTAFPHVTVHRTDPDSARNIIAHGISIRTDRPEPGWGFGFYASTRGDPQYGEAEVRVAIRLDRPLILPDSIRGAEVIDDLLRRTGAEDTRAAVLAAGYDGVLLHLDRSETWVVAYHGHQVRVVMGRRPHV
jgi:hypothetical protein